MLPLALFYLFLAVDALFILTVVVLWLHPKKERVKRLFFGLYLVIVLGATLYLVYYTISKNLASITMGPVHWHAQFEVYACGEKIELEDPSGWSNKVGTDLLHEHNDNLIHVEGVVNNRGSVTLGEFFKVAGGEMTNRTLTVVTNDPPGVVKTYYECNGQQGNLNVFVIKTIDQQVKQEKLTDPANYVISPYSQVPPGDCIIIEFNGEKERTDKLCSGYTSLEAKGELNHVD